jgi:hypothetical protein
MKVTDVAMYFMAFIRDKGSYTRIKRWLWPATAAAAVTKPPIVITPERALLGPIKQSRANQ